MLEISFTEAWHAHFVGGHVGLLLLGPVDNRRRPTPLDEMKRALAADLRRRYGGLTRADLQQLPVLAAYKRYYRQFNKTYHVQLQLESVVHKGKALPAVNPLVDTCFAAELETHLLTASHDADRLAPPIAVDASSGDETLHLLSGRRRTIKAHDMMMTDAQGVVCTIIYGQDRRTAVTEATRRVLYVTYAPAGIATEAVAAHHQRLGDHVRLLAPGATVLAERIVTAGG